MAATALASTGFVSLQSARPELKAGWGRRVWGSKGDELRASIERANHGPIRASCHSSRDQVCRYVWCKALAMGAAALGA